VVHQDLSGLGEGLLRLDGAVRQDLEDEAVEVGDLADAGVLDDEVDLLDRVKIASIGISPSE
jgi:hypothetical protein